MPLNPTVVSDTLYVGRRVWVHVTQVVHDTLYVQSPPPIHVETAHPDPLWTKIIGPAVGGLIGGLIGAASGLAAIWLKHWLDAHKDERKVRHRLALVANEIQTTIGTVYEKAQRGTGPAPGEMEAIEESIAQLDALGEHFSDIRDPILFTTLVEWQGLLRNIRDRLSRLNSYVQGLQAVERGATHIDKEGVEDAAKKVRGEIARVLKIARDLGVKIDVFENVKTGDLIPLARPGTDSPYFKDRREPWLMRWFRKIFRRREKPKDPEARS